MTKEASRLMEALEVDLRARRNTPQQVIMQIGEKQVRKHQGIAERG